MKKYQTYIIGGVGIIIGLMGGYFWGKASVNNARGGFGGMAGVNFSSSTRAKFGSGVGVGAAGAGMNLTAGQVSALGSSSLTLQLANGNSEVVLYSSSTEVTKPTMVPISELTSGSNVMIGGIANSDGSFTAQSIQVRPATTQR